MSGGLEWAYEQSWNEQGPNYDPEKAAREEENYKNAIAAQKERDRAWNARDIDGIRKEVAELYEECMFFNKQSQKILGKPPFTLYFYYDVDIQLATEDTDSFGRAYDTLTKDIILQLPREELKIVKNQFEIRIEGAKKVIEKGYSAYAETREDNKKQVLKELSETENKLKNLKAWKESFK